MAHILSDVDPTPARGLAHDLAVLTSDAKVDDVKDKETVDRRTEVGKQLVEEQPKKVAESEPAVLASHARAAESATGVAKPASEKAKSTSDK